MPRHPDLSLQRLLEAQHSGVSIATTHKGDRALVAGEYDRAATAYATVDSPSKSVRAKRGYALARLGGYKEALDYINRDNVGNHPDAQAVLAAALHHGRDAMSTGTSQRATISALLSSVLAHPAPSALAFRVVLSLWFRAGTGERPLEVAERAVHAHPDDPWLAAVLARERRGADRSDVATLAMLEPFLDAKIATVLVEALLAALHLKDFDAARRLIGRIRHAAADPPAQTGPGRDLCLLAAYVELCAARCGDATAATLGWSLVEHLLVDAGTPFDDGGPWGADVARVALSLAAEASDKSRIQTAVAALIEHFYDLDTPSGMPDSVFMRLTLPNHDENFIANLDVPWLEYAECAQLALDAGGRIYFKLILACARSNLDLQTEEDLRVLRSEGPDWGPLSELSTLLQAQIDNEPVNTDGLGTLLARTAVAAEDSTRLAAELCFYTETLSEAGSETISAAFDTALDEMEERELGTGEQMLVAWGELLAKHAPEQLSRLGVWIEGRTGKKPLLPVAPDPLQEILAAKPSLDECPTEPASLSLLEAAALVALMRCDIDHTSWTVGAINQSLQPFEPNPNAPPNKRFVRVLFDLMDKGVIAISQATPKGVLTVQDGRLSAYLERVIWRISAKTLTLHRAVRDLPQGRWPVEWREQAPLLSRDLGAQELLVYMGHLCSERRLESPEPDVVLTHLCALLEHRSIAHGYYIVHKTVKEATDYAAKYRPKPQSQLTRLYNLLRGNVEKSLAADWDTAFRRENDLPASLLFDALHGTLTRWGSRAFDEPIYQLPMTNVDA